MTAPAPARSLSLAEARRIALDAQGFRDPAPAGRVDIRHLRRVLRRIRILQIDAVNVLVRAHYLPLFARLGPYPRELLRDAAYRRRELFEYWAHEASLIPIDDHPLHRWNMRRIEQDASAWKRMTAFAQDNAALVAAVEEEVAERGPLAAGELEDGGERKGPWWGWADGKTALEWLFAIGRVAVHGRRNFTRLYDLTERVIPEEVLDRPEPSEDEAARRLVLGATTALGVALPNAIADYYRIRVDRARRALSELVDDGEVIPVAVEGWRGTAYAPADVTLPRAVDARALISPFDSLIWHRERTERLFDLRYRIEIYVPKEKRVHGYYVLPFLLGDRLVGRVDLKADRDAGVLRVPGAFAEDGVDRAEVVEPLAAELRSMAGWLGLDAVAVGRRGDLARPLRAEFRGAG